MDLRTPTGAALTLTGTWLGDDNGYWQVYQQGQCVWWTGSPGVYEQVTMRGTVSPDFTIGVEWESVGITPPDGRVRGAWGTATLRIDLSDPTMLTIRAVGTSISPTKQMGVGLHSTEWTRVTEEPIFPPPTPKP
jgi:hypothetical protein